MKADTVTVRLAGQTLAGVIQTTLAPRLSCREPLPGGCGGPPETQAHPVRPDALARVSILRHVHLWHAVVLAAGCWTSQGFFPRKILTFKRFLSLALPSPPESFLNKLPCVSSEHRKHSNSRRKECSRPGRSSALTQLPKRVCLLNLCWHFLRSPSPITQRGGNGSWAQYCTTGRSGRK